MVTATDDVWEKYLVSHSDAKPLRNKPFPLYDEIDKLCARTTATAFNAGHRRPRPTFPTPRSSSSDGDSEDEGDGGKTDGGSVPVKETSTQVSKSNHASRKPAEKKSKITSVTTSVSVSRQRRGSARVPSHRRLGQRGRRENRIKDTVLQPQLGTGKGPRNLAKSPCPQNAN